ncbi:hypothetical protein PhaeoP48_03856 (plasmid) [Phaeobacter inhibens]|uniref:hypothetical protein n=1 Tax=Phaeobacter inhibens TaxID=221822 RepID=UPI000C99CE38|nr:hypothetical protein [Phaeobacter inhibens]AUR13794.1 hypothetical protein PhaeoP48_03856 [Phaeobacter inhibens]
MTEQQSLSTAPAQGSEGLTVALHIGAPFTDEDQLVWSLRKDAGRLLKDGVLVRRPGTYMKELTDLKGRAAKADVSEEDCGAFLDGVLREADASRVVLSMSSILGVPAWMLNGGRLYKNAGANTAALRSVFPQTRCEFFLGLCNPATLVPTAFGAQTQKDWYDFAGDTDLMALRWSEVVGDILNANPECGITVWCNEETPVVWPQVLGQVTGQGAGYRFAGETDILRQAMTEEGTRRLEAYLTARPKLSEAQRDQVRELFLSYFHSEDAVEEEIDLPGWSQGFVDTMTDRYFEDVELIRNIPGVTVIG